MKLLCPLFCFFVAFCGTQVVAQLPAVTGHSLLLDVENKGTGGKGNGTLNAPAIVGGPMGTSNFTENRSQCHTTTLSITIRSQDKTPTQIQVEWYFIARGFLNNRVSKDGVFDSGTKTITMQPNGSETFDVTSKEAQTTVSRSYQTTTSYSGSNGNTTTSTMSTGPDMRNGMKISGWVVRILIDGKIYDAKGSEFKYEDAAKTPDKFGGFSLGN